MHKPSTIAADGEHIDCYIGPNPDGAKFVYIVHQWINDEYDEDKCCIGFNSAEDAQQCYRDHMSAPNAMHSMSILPVDEFIEKVKGTRENPGKIHAAELTRDLKPHDQHHDFAGHVKRQDQTQTAIRRILGSSKMALMSDAARRASALSPEHLDSLSLPFPHGLAARVAKSAGIANQYGRDQVYAERFRATKRPKTTAAVHLDDSDPGTSAEQDTPDLIGKAAVADMQNWITSRTKGAHVDAYTKGLRNDQLQQAIEDNLAAGSDAMLDRIAAEASRSALAGGRYSALQELEGEISKYVRTEAMDQNTCEDCQAGDGTMWNSLAEVDWSPGDDCSGGDACRGQLLPIFSDEGTVTAG